MRRSSWIGLLLLLFLVILSILGRIVCSPKKMVRAVVERLSGGVTSLLDGDTETKILHKQQMLYDGDIILTDASGKMTFKFYEGLRLEMQPLSRLRFGDFQIQSVYPYLKILTGSVHVKINQQSPAVLLATPIGLTNVGPYIGAIEIDVNKGISVSVGSLDVLPRDSNQWIKLHAGEMLTLDGKVVLLVSQDKLSGKKFYETVEGSVMDVHGEGGAVGVQSNHSEQWDFSKKSFVLHPGEKLLTDRSSKAQGSIASHVWLDFFNRTQITLDEVSISSTQVKAQISLQEGHMRSVIEKTIDPNFSDQFILRLQEHALQLKPSVWRSSCEVSTHNGQTKLWLRFGNASILSLSQDKDQKPSVANTVITDVIEHPSIEPGYRYLVGPYGFGQALPLADFFVAVHEMDKSKIYYKKAIPALQFTWVPSQASSDVLEVSYDKEFKDRIGSEEVKTGHFMMDGFSSRTIYWRHQNNPAIYEVQFLKELEEDCAKCFRNNIVDDAGDTTHVVFQKAMPSIVLRWQEVPEAKSYHLKVFKNNAFEKPVFEKTSNTNTFTLFANQLAEGSYYWMVSSIDPQDRENVFGSTNLLNISYDQTVANFYLNNNSQRRVVRKKVLWLAGTVLPKSVLHLGDQPIAVDKKGRFKHRIVLQKGENRLTFYVRSADGIERIYTRQYIYTQ